MNLSRAEKEEVSQLVETHNASTYTPPQDPISGWKQTIVIVLTVIAMAVGAALWASNAHAEIKDWTAEQDFVTKSELKEVIKEQYVPRYEFVIVKEKLENHEKQHLLLQKTLDKIEEKMDKITEGQSKGRRLVTTTD